MNRTIIFHVPHDGNQLKEELMSSVVIDRDLFLWYHNKMRDMDATLFAPEIDGAKIIKFDVSRLLCDVERFIGDAEIMEKYGMGFCYERVYDGTVIKSVDQRLKEKTYALYAQHHNYLDETVKNASDDIVLIDLHSFSEDLIVHQDITKALPDICIGCEDDMPDELKNRIVSVFMDQGFSVDVNYPYQGSMIPNCILSKTVKKKLISFMVEVNKDCYIRNGETDASRIEKIRNAIKNIIRIMEAGS